MATRRWMTTRGETDKDVTEAVGAATVTKKLEVTMDLTTGFTKEEFLLGLDRIKRHVISGVWPPA